MANLMPGEWDYAKRGGFPHGGFEQRPGLLGSAMRGLLGVPQKIGGLLSAPFFRDLADDPEARRVALAALGGGLLSGDPFAPLRARRAADDVRTDRLRREALEMRLGDLRRERAEGEAVGSALRVAGLRQPGAPSAISNPQSQAEKLAYATTEVNLPRTPSLPAQYAAAAGSLARQGHGGPSLELAEAAQKMMPKPKRPQYVGPGGVLVDPESNDVVFENPVKERPREPERPFTMNTARGLMEWDPTSGQWSVVPGTEPTGSSGRPMPMGLADDLKGNAQVIGLIDQTFPMLRTPAGRKATGVRNAAINMLTPDALADNVKNAVDPKGTELRALVTNLNSFIVKQRNGAAVTVAEFARQRGYLPSDTDSPTVLQTKLTKLRAALEAENQYISDFAESQGYRRPPTSNSGMTVFPNGTPMAARADAASPRPRRPLSDFGG